MTIDRVGGDPTAAAKANRAAEQQDAGAGERSDLTGAGPNRTDQVEISAEGRALSDVYGLGPTRLAQIHERLDSGAYDTPEVAERIAQRLLPEIV